MRSALLVGSVLALWPAVALAQAATPYYATVTDPSATLRAGPSDKYPETGTLPRGTRVIVHEETNGWLAVQAPGAVSWVPTQFIDFDPTRKIPQNVMTQDPVELAPGKVGLPQPLTEVRLVKLPAGTLLTVIGTPEKFDNKTWHPIEPVAGDYRYLPKTAVQTGGTVNTSFVVRDTTPAGGPASPTLLPPSGTLENPASPKPKPMVSHPLWAQAEAAEKDGRLDEAEKLYFQLARLMNEPGGDHDIANLCYTRIHALREKRRRSNAPPATGGVLATAATKPEPPAPRTDVPSTKPPHEDRVTLLPPVRNDSSEAARITPVAAESPSGRTPKKSDPLAASPEKPTSPAASSTPQWVGPGMLVRTPVVIEGKQTYVLESAPGIPKVYVIGAKDVELRPYVNRRVDLFGTTASHKDLSKPYVEVTYIDPNP